MIKSSRLALNDGFSQVYSLPIAPTRRWAAQATLGIGFRFHFFLFLQSSLVFEQESLGRGLASVLIQA